MSPAARSRRLQEAAADAKLLTKEDLDSQKKKVSYAIGLDIGQNFKTRAMDVDLDILFQGMKDAQKTEKPLLDSEEIQKVMTQFQQEMMKAEQEKRAVQGLGNKSKEEAFLKENAQKPGVKVTASGLQYKVISEGTGPLPKESDTVKVHYRGTLLDGTEFDSSYKRNQPAVFPLKGVIKGWTEALQLMKVGSKYQIFLPSSLAYGENGAGQVIGPNATLIFEVELLGHREARAGSQEMNWPKLLASVAACQLAGVLGAIFTRSAIPVWYAALKKPPFAPPNWLFGPTWISLYLLMAVAAYLVWQKGLAHPGVRAALARLRLPAAAQCAVVAGIFRPALAAGRRGGHRPSLAGHRADHAPVLESIAPGGLAAAPLSPLGQLASALNISIYF